MSYGMGGCCQYNELMPFPPRFSLDSVLFGMMMLFLWAAIFAFRYWQYLCAGKHEDPQDVRKWGWISFGLFAACLSSGAIFLLRIFLRP